MTLSECKEASIVHLLPCVQTTMNKRFCSTTGQYFLACFRDGCAMDGAWFVPLYRCVVLRESTAGTRRWLMWYHTCLYRD